MVARNDRGEVLASQATLEEATASHFAAEACACTQAVRLRIQMGARKVEIEGDALWILYALADKERGSLTEGWGGAKPMERMLRIGILSLEASSSRLGVLEPSSK
ncbi:hypothetical protein Godav_024728 [Gossypium davidsonii]|uniref:RNase H type-1 domain-containing protein n=1 Tax=Gossypium davidsonii TaxID=34287 RepID=A0A7J8TAA1_GOSDV|nr:hypothetical protein [Gossypium davidsonii]